MSHHHHHDHDHHHSESPLTFEEQLKTLFSHWIKHNESHAGTYRDWAEKARKNQMEKTAVLLDEIASLTDDVSRKIEEASESVE